MNILFGNGSSLQCALPFSCSPLLVVFVTAEGEARRQCKGQMLTGPFGQEKLRREKKEETFQRSNGLLEVLSAGGFEVAGTGAACHDGACKKRECDAVREWPRHGHSDT